MTLVNNLVCILYLLNLPPLLKSRLNVLLINSESKTNSLRSSKKISNKRRYYLSRNKN